MIAAFRRRTLQRRKSAIRRRIRERMARQAAQEYKLTFSLFSKLWRRLKKTCCVESARGIGEVLLKIYVCALL